LRRTLSIPFLNHRYAEIAVQSLAVDADVDPERASRTYRVTEPNEKGLVHVEMYGCTDMRWFK
jgi:hypothetical protein